MSTTDRTPPARRPLAAWRPAALALIVALAATACGSGGASPSASPRAAVSPSAAPTATATPSPTPAPTPTATPAPTPTPLVEPADLTGLLVAPELAHRIPLAVMIDDSKKARPQSGFNAASIVYQALADGYESRYLLVFQEGETDAIGPVRSARFFLVEWSQEVRAALAHYGGDRRTRSYISGTVGRYGTSRFTDVDGLGRGRPAYHRIKSRKAPHNAYTSTEDLRRVALKLGAPEELDADVYRRSFRDPSPLAARAEAQSVRIPYHTNVIDYRYDRERNIYLRSVNGKKHIDPADDEQVTTTNIVVLFQKFRIDTKIEPGHSRPDITTIGTGKAWIFSEGKLVKGSWRKKSHGGPTRVYDADGKEIVLVRGRTFFQVVPPGTKITVKD
jgi:hypothetical protein